MVFLVIKSYLFVWRLIQSYCVCEPKTKFARNVRQLFLAKVTAEERRGASFGPKKNGGLNYSCL